MPISRRFLVSSLFAVAVAVAVGVAFAAGILDGRTFAGETGEVGKKTGDKDSFVFAAGTFRSTACDKYGFNAAAYTATRNADGSIAFAATTVSAKEGEMVWKGTVKGDAIEGTVAWSKKGQKRIDYWLKGAAQKVEK